MVLRNRVLAISLLLLVVFGSQLTTEAEERYSTEELVSHSLGGPRKIRIYLPPSYSSDRNRSYPVLYVHDGQNAFSFSGTNAAFGWGTWELDKTADALAREGKMQEILIVGVDNSRNRYAEYCGETRGTNGPPTAFENYADFLINELKPYIDKKYRTQTSAANTGVMGSSMGGICSLAMAWHHPDVFGRAASLAGAYQVTTNFLIRELRPYQQTSKPIRLYFDSGTVDFMGGDDGRAQTEAVVSELRRIGWDKELMHFVDLKPMTPAELEKTGLRHDKWAEAQTSQHNEFYWRMRVWRPLTFLFKPQ
jgi:predicted alpha/beta superfamily hydrolase